MANGITAIQVDAAAIKTALVTSALPVYLGSAPIWQVDDENWANLAGKTIVAKSLDEVRSAIGYSIPVSGAFDKSASLSMVLYYHYQVEKILPVILIVNKAAITTSASPTEAEVTFVKGKATIAGSNIVLHSVSISGKTKGTDYTVAYDTNGQNVLIYSSTMDTATVTYNTVTTDSITFNKDTYEEINYIPQNTGYLPSYISAPLWDNEDATDGVKVAVKLASIAENVVDKHYYVQAFAQLSAGTRAAAIKEKEAYNSAKEKVCWPWVKINGYVFPVSLVFSARRETVDKNNDGIPYESASNEQVTITELCDASGNTIKQLESEADSLCEVGIATMAFTTKMSWNTWGVCMANYSEADKGNISPNKLNDVAVQMMDYICNDFEQTFGDQVHKPMSTRDVNNIISVYQKTLNSYISSGMLIAGTISFEASENSTAQLADGQFTYTITETNTPPAKAIIAKVTYDSDALNSYFEEQGGEA